MAKKSKGKKTKKKGGGGGGSAPTPVTDESYSFTNTKGQKVVKYKTGETVKTGGGLPDEVVKSKLPTGLKQINVGGKVKTVRTGSKADAKYTGMGATTYEPGVISSNRGKEKVKEADKAMDRLAPEPISADPTQPTGQTGVPAPISATTPAPTTPTAAPTTPAPTPTTPDTSTDFVTLYNQTTGQEKTLRGAAANPTNINAALKEGYSMAVSDTSTAPETPTQTQIKQVEGEVGILQNNINAYTSKLESTLITDKELRGEIRTISKGYNARIQEAQEITERRKQTINTLGTRLGARYTGGTGGILGGIISEEERQGLARITAIENEKQKAISDAKTEARNYNYSAYTKLMAQAEKLQEDKKKELATLKEAQRLQDEKIAEEKQQAEYDALIADQLAAGVTDPLELVKALGGKVPFDQIKAITDLMPKKPEDFTLSEGQARYDATGKLIAARAKTYKPEGGTGIGGALSPEATYWAQLINQGRAKLENVPEKLRSAVVTALASGDPTMSKANEQAVSQANTAITAIDTALDNLKEAGTFERFALGKVPGTLARDTENTIETIQALIGFDALAQMRAASPTGGALGSITEKELRYLQSVQGSLDPLQSTETLKTNLGSIRKSFARIRAINSVETTPEQYKKDFPDATEEELSEIRARSTVKEVQDNASMTSRDLFNTGPWVTNMTTPSVLNEDENVFKFIGINVGS